MLPFFLQYVLENSFLFFSKPVTRCRRPILFHLSPATEKPVKIAKQKKRKEALTITWAKFIGNRSPVQQRESRANMEGRNLWRPRCASFFFRLNGDTKDKAEASNFAGRHNNESQSDRSVLVVVGRRRVCIHATVKKKNSQQQPWREEVRINNRVERARRLPSSFLSSARALPSSRCLSDTERAVFTVIFTCTQTHVALQEQQHAMGKLFFSPIKVHLGCIPRRRRRRQKATKRK